MIKSTSLFSRCVSMQTGANEQASAASWKHHGLKCRLEASLWLIIFVRYVIEINLKIAPRIATKHLFGNNTVEAHWRWGDPALGLLGRTNAFGRLVTHDKYSNQFQMSCKLGANALALQRVWHSKLSPWSRNLWVSDGIWSTQQPKPLPFLQILHWPNSHPKVLPSHAACIGAPCFWIVNQFCHPVSPGPGKLVQTLLASGARTACSKLFILLQQCLSKNSRASFNSTLQRTQVILSCSLKVGKTKHMVHTMLRKDQQNVPSVYLLIPALTRSIWVFYTNHP